MASENTAQNRVAARHKWRLHALQAALLMALWLVLSGHYDPFHLALGAISVGLVLWINRKIFLVEPDLVTSRSHLRVDRNLLYVPWLAWQMVLSGVYVARVVIHPRMPIAPRLIRFKSRQPNDLTRVILGNSITLTPGTLTLEIEGDEFLVHALTEESAAGVLDGTMQTKVARLYLSTPERMVYDVQTISETEGQ